MDVSDLQTSVPKRRDLLDLADKVIVVTGGASGFGRETAVLAGVQGAAVVVADIDGAGAENTAAGLRAAGVEATAVHADVTVRTDVQRAVDTALELGGRLDGLCNIAGTEGVRAEVLELDEADFDRTMAINGRSVVLATQIAARVMVQQGWGCIINYSSATIDRSTVGLTGYAASKAAVAQITKTTARELGPHGVRVNGIAPGWVETPMSARTAGYLLEGVRIDEAARASYLTALKTRVPLRDLGTAADLASLTVFLLSDAGRFLTGQTIRVDGGLSIV